MNDQTRPIPGFSANATPAETQESKAIGAANAAWLAYTIATASYEHGGVTYSTRLYHENAADRGALFPRARAILWRGETEIARGLWAPGAGLTFETASLGDPIVLIVELLEARLLAIMISAAPEPEPPKLEHLHGLGDAAGWMTIRWNMQHGPLAAPGGLIYLPCGGNCGRVLLAQPNVVVTSCGRCVATEDAFAPASIEYATEEAIAALREAGGVVEEPVEGGPPRWGLFPPPDGIHLPLRVVERTVRVGSNGTRELGVLVDGDDDPSAWKPAIWLDAVDAEEVG